MLPLEQLLGDRILLLDGGMGSLIQQYHLKEADYRGARFAHLPGAQQGNGEALNVTRPDVIQAIHRQYLEAGADMIETNTLNATSISLVDYGMENYVRELNLAAVQLAKEVADRYTRSNPDKPRFVAGSIGPTNKTASLSPDVSNPAFRSITFDDLHKAYKEQIEAMIDGGVDALLIETSFDTLNVKAALMAAEEAMTQRGREVALMLSYTIAGKSGRILSGQTLDAALASVSHVKLLSIGLNCSFGARDMKPFLKELGRIAPCYISAYPNAGLPNSLGQYDETPETMALQVKEYLDEGLVNIIGGCCGTTPAHIAAIAQVIKQGQCRKHEINRTASAGQLQLSGLDVLDVKPFTFIGERCNVAGSRKFLRLIQEKKYEEALNIARKQVDDGAQILDVNVDDGLLDGVHEMTNFLNLIASEPDIAKAPIMIDSSDWNIIEAGLKCLQGKSIVNSISLKNGEEDFLNKAKKIKSCGAAVIVMAFDEKGQADTFERKIEVCERMYRLLTEKAGFHPQNIIFDPNVLAIGTGIEMHNRYADDFIRATEWIKQRLPKAKVSGGISNLSFAFRGNSYLREAIHAVFLFHAIQKGMDMGIVNPSVSVNCEDIPADLRDSIEDLIFNRKPDATERLLERAQTLGAESVRSQTETADTWRTLPVDERLKYALLKGIDNYLETDLQEALALYPQPVNIIDQPLMEGMNAVGQLFGDGKMFLPQVVKTARTMKKAVAILQPYIESSREKNASKAGKILIATVKGDVHDIGKNITGVILSCNNYEVIDLGVMVPPEEILQKAQEYQVDLIALSGLITPSLQEMSFVASEMEKAGFTKPLLIGGATTSPLHTALKIAPLYRGAVIHTTDASKAIPVLRQLLNPQTQESCIESLKSAQQALRDQAINKKELVTLDYARKHPLRINHSHRNPEPAIKGSHIINFIPLQEITPYLDWGAFLSAWKLPVKYARYTPETRVEEAEKDRYQEARQLRNDAEQILAEWTRQDAKFIRAIVGLYPVRIDSECLLIDEQLRIPLLRQQEKRDDDTYKSLLDFIRPEGDYIGLFTVTAGEKTHPQTCHCASHTDDSYRAMLEQILKDRLAEAATEYLHEKVEKEYWGYNPGEANALAHSSKKARTGIRPASGYPSLPDLSLNFAIDKLLKMNRIGITLTANGALYPNATTAGLIIAHPESSYFYIGAIGDDQLTDYAQKTGRTPEETRKWLGK